MNIYLTSYGLDTRYKDYMFSYNDIIKILKNKRVAIIPNAKLKSQDRTTAEVAKQELEKNNIRATIIDIEKEKLNLYLYNALYLSGGEPKYLIDAIYKANLFDMIKNL